MVVVGSTAEEVVDATGEAVEFECRRFGAGSSQRQQVVSWLRERGVTEVVMESTAQYWKPVWLDLEPHFAKLHLAQAHSHRAPRGRKNDFRDAKRLARRLLAEELILSFVPEALSQGETDPGRLAELGDDRLKCSKQELTDVLAGSPEPLHLEILKLYLERLQLLDRQIQSLDVLVAKELRKHQDAVLRIAEMPGFGVDSAQQIIAEIGVDAAAFPTAAHVCSWAGTCPGRHESAEQNHSSRSPKGNRFVRRILTQAAQAAVKKKGSHFRSLFHRLLIKLGYKGAIWAIAHRLGRLLWKIVHDGVHYIEQGQETNPEAKKRRAQKLRRALRNLGYQVTLTPIQSTPIQEQQG